MKSDAHLQKAERITRQIAKIGARFHEARVEAAMLAATHWTNRSLHILGILPEAHDMIHTDYLTGADHLRLKLVAPALLAAVEGIEDLRAPYVRGAAPDRVAAGETAIRLLALVEVEARKVRAPELPFVTYSPHAT